MWDCRLSTGHPPSSRLCRLWSQKGDLQRAWNRDRKAVWDQVGLSHCRHEGLVMVQDKVCLRRGHDDQSRQGHQCSETMLTEESWFHISTPLGILNLGPLWREANRLVHWTSETWWESCEIAGSPHHAKSNWQKHPQKTGLLVKNVSKFFPVDFSFSDGIMLYRDVSWLEYAVDLPTRLDEGELLPGEGGGDGGQGADTQDHDQGKPKHACKKGM